MKYRKNYTVTTRLKLLGIRILRLSAWTTSDHKNLDRVREHVLKDKQDDTKCKTCRGVGRIKVNVIDICNKTRDVGSMRCPDCVIPKGTGS